MRRRVKSKLLTEKTKLILANLPVIVPVDLMHELSDLFAGKAFGVILLEHVVKHDLHVLKGHQVVTVGVELIEVLAAELLRVGLALLATAGCLVSRNGESAGVRAFVRGDPPFLRLLLFYSSLARRART